ncbi:MAG: hypothetical protein QOE92_1590 [Chloroflexota bacterium]|jgi:plastocyanin|nr:hypothetical protein [Chloroflexota bacterium]
MFGTRIVSFLGMGILAFGMAACGSSSTSDTGGGSANVTCTASDKTVCVEADPTNVGKFNPATSNVKVGDTVTWTIMDDANPHTVTFDDSSLDSGSQNKGYTTTKTFSAAGTFTYKCSLHAAMVGKVVVT